eukprot:TRINITY_DN1739_c0_g4_i7.p1 TRINITY_DN1739_c0_g4~~TRINITY_DN1739_c0_g4_i7.p1  ORF type:complete len:207 (+),score=19.17 TRINITY_DN1739_c0_g4_i7:96-716(+)
MYIITSLIVIGIFCVVLILRRSAKINYLTQKFDQTFSKYPKIGCTKCSFIHRTIKGCTPPKDQQIPPSEKLPQHYQDFGKLWDGERTYYLHIPNELRNVKEKLSLVILVHGTDETAFDGELLQHQGRKTWLEASHKYGVPLLFTQARGMWGTYTSPWRDPSDPLKTLWLPKCIDPSTTDHLYIERAGTYMCKNKKKDDHGLICENF